MKVHYINILLFALPLNILAHNKNKPQTTQRHTPTTRLLCECDLYMPNYDNDQEMKFVIENFNKQTQQRFEEYDERIQSKRKQCKDKCDKEIQKIILKDKLEKELMDKFATLQTDIQNDAIPTCVCEKSVADKVEKTCLKCTQNLGGIVAPSSGVLAGIAEGAVIVWKPLALSAAKEAAKDAAIAAGKAAGDAYGKKVVIDTLIHYKFDTMFPNIFKSIRNITNYAEVTKFSGDIVKKYNTTCSLGVTKSAEWTQFEYDVGIFAEDDPKYFQKAEEAVQKFMKSVVQQSEAPAEAKATQVAAVKAPVLEAAEVDAVNATYASYQTAIIASVVAIVVIVLIMVIIYKILRYICQLPDCYYCFRRCNSGNSFNYGNNI
ncbi:rifin [Plasmodium reichenowi]|uniref:Rifin n=1 Tax=Plasmodium reichenowi TaxID=5854 RepID=A0A060RM29_PLARE|nr:rifin [Plasmodium reichenowi]